MCIIANIGTLHDSIMQWCDLAEKQDLFQALCRDSRESLDMNLVLGCYNNAYFSVLLFNAAILTCISQWEDIIASIEDNVELHTETCKLFAASSSKELLLNMST